MSQEYRGGSLPVPACGNSERLGPLGAKNEESWVNAVHILMYYSLCLECTRKAIGKV